MFVGREKIGHESGPRQSTLVSNPLSSHKEITYRVGTSLSKGRLIEETRYRNERHYSVLYRLRSHLMKELEINDTPYGLRVMATDHPVNKSVGKCPEDISTRKLDQLVGVHESIWMGGSPDWTALQLHLGRLRKDRFKYDGVENNNNNNNKKEKGKKEGKTQQHPIRHNKMLPKNPFANPYITNLLLKALLLGSSRKLVMGRFFQK